MTTSPRAACAGTGTGVEIVDTLDVVAHERCQELERRLVVTQAFVD